MGEHAVKAKELFDQGYNCAQSVLGAFAQELGMPFELAMRAASGLGGGLGRLRETCGAVTGMVEALTLAQGYHLPEQTEEKKALYASIQKLVLEFKEENGSILCRELLGEEGMDNVPNPSPRTDAYYRRRPCGELVACAAQLLENYLEAEKTKA